MGIRSLLAERIQPLEMSSLSTPLRFVLLVMGALLTLSPVHAKDANATADDPERWSILVTFGDDICPESTDSEIIVCARQPEEERYRIPKDIREKEKEEEAQYAMSWTAQFQNHEDEARLGRPNSCSVAGTNGFTGCQAAALRQWFAERNLDSSE